MCRDGDAELRRDAIKFHVAVVGHVNLGVLGQDGIVELQTRSAQRHIVEGRFLGVSYHLTWCPLSSKDVERLKRSSIDVSCEYKVTAKGDLQ